MKESSIYIHIPFCDHKCIYCDFYSIITSDNIDNFLQSLLTEIKFYSKNYADGRVFSTIFFGGGTPSLMKPEYLSRIISGLKNNFNISNDAEITMETNPGTVDKEKLLQFFNSGINRLSIGIQSFHNDDLSFLTRIHNKETAIETVYNAVKAGFENINIDLIFNLPNQTKEKWKQNLETSLSLPVKHISAYSLILERGTILNKMVLDKKVTIREEDYDAELYEMAIDNLTAAGFGQYEVSNFAKPGFECRHNKAYWRYNEYLGFGPSAHSFVGGRRWWNYSSLKHYIKVIEVNNHAQCGDELLSEEQKLDEYIMLALRSYGLNINDFIKRFGEAWLQKNQHYIQTLINANIVERTEDFIRLTRRGYPVCDEILRNLL